MFCFYSCSDKKCPGYEAEADIKKENIHLISYGLPDIISAAKVDSLAKKYGFYYQNRGCIPPAMKEVECTHIYNQKIIDYLSGRNGKGWFAKYEKTEDSLRKECFKSFHENK